MLGRIQEAAHKGLIDSITVENLSQECAVEAEEYADERHEDIP